MEVALFDGADRCNNVCHGDKLFTMEEEEDSSSAAAEQSCSVGLCRIKGPLNNLNKSNECAVFDAVAGVVRSTVAMGRAPNGLCCDGLFIIVAMA